MAESAKRSDPNLMATFPECKAKRTTNPSHVICATKHSISLMKSPHNSTQMNELHAHVARRAAYSYRAVCNIARAINIESSPKAT